MTTQISYTPLGGGLDFLSSALAIKPGEMTDCLNFEERFGVQGYRRIPGYERYDGRLQPHLADYATQPFKLGTAAFIVGEIVTGPSATGQVISVTVQSGSFGAGTAAGFIVVTNLTGMWNTNESILSAGNPRAIAADITLQSDITSPDHYNYLRLARQARRNVIQKVPGEGKVLGVVLYLGVIYAVRNIVGGGSATMWKATAAGWVAVKTGMSAGGRYRFEVANFTGDAKTIKLFGVNGRGRYFSYDGTTLTYAAAIYGSEGTSGTSNSISTGSHTFTIAESTRSWIAGDVLTAASTLDDGNSMTGTVTSYSGTSLVLNVTSIKGSGTYTNWTISKADYSDRPYDLIAFRDHMFLAYPRGQLQSSNLGDPMNATTTASLFAVGDEITNLASLKGATLAVFSRNRISTVTGTSALDFVLDKFADGTGAILGTAQENSGNVIFLDERGVMSLQATQDYGAFAPSIFSEKVRNLLTPLIPNMVGSRMTREGYQYRLYTDSGKVITFGLMTPAQVIKPKDVSATTQQYLHIPSCFATGGLASFGLDDGEDAIFFGTTDGYVMRESTGTSFDGAVIEGLIRLPFDHYKSPSNNKRFLKLIMELETKDPVDLRFLQLFDYDDGMFEKSANQVVGATASGGQYDTSLWNTFFWSLPIISQAEVNVDGIGRNMALILWCSSDVIDPFILQGLMTQYSVRSLRR